MCRSPVVVPAGSAAAFPPSYVYNQLLDLLQNTQRREVRPKCAMHAEQELQFCEGCDAIFCPRCLGDEHRGAASVAGPSGPVPIIHNVISLVLVYSIANALDNTVLYQ